MSTVYLHMNTLYTEFQIYFLDEIKTIQDRINPTDFKKLSTQLN